MAFSPSSRQRSRFARGMSQDENNTNHSCASSTGSHHGTVSDSTISDFDPENEAIMSTRQMDFNLSQKLPELRDTARKYGRWNGNRQPDFIINTSAIGRAFPDFSQGGSSDDSMSIEVGRGAKTRQRTPAQQGRPQYSNNIDSPVVTIGDFQILSTPPIKSQSKSSLHQDIQRENARKEGHNKRASSSQKENIPPTHKTTSAKRIPNYVSGATRTSSGEQRRTLAELHAQVADESEGSFIGDERPPMNTQSAKASRFSNFQPTKSPLVNVNSENKQKVADALVGAFADRRSQPQAETPSKPPSNGTVTSNAFNPTNQSFLLPNMPEISELVSGTFKDGTPVFTRSGKVQSRFSSNINNWKADHNELDGIAVPQDEKDIFLSLQLLQEKVDALEMDKAENHRVLEELQNQNYHLQAEKDEFQRRHRSDSALGMADSGSDGGYARDNQKLAAEKTKLEAQLMSLQNHLDTSDRKVSNLELRLKTNTSERDQAVKQLAEAYYNSEQLKADNELLREENESLKRKLNVGNVSLRDENEALRKLLMSGNESLRKEHESLKQRSDAEKDFIRQEAESFKEQLAQLASDREKNERNWQQKENSLRRKLQRREDALQEMREITREVKVIRESKSRAYKAHATEFDLPQPSRSKRVSIDHEFEEPVRTGTEVHVQESAQQSKPSISYQVTRGRSSLVVAPTDSPNHSGLRLKSRSRSRSKAMRSKQPMTSERQRAMLMDYNNDIQFDDTTQEESFGETTKTIHKDINVNRESNDLDCTQGTNYSSILGHGEMDRMREIVADVRAEQQQRLATGKLEQNLENDTVRSTRSVVSAPEENVSAQNKSYKKGLTGILKNRDAQDQDDGTERLSVKSGGQDVTGQDHTNQSGITHQRRHSESSVRIRPRNRHHIVGEEMTSAFILPDIVIQGNSYGTEHKSLSASARKVLDNLAQHDCHNCTVCSRIASFETENASIKIDTKKTIRVEKPIPVSDRMPISVPYEDEPTMRPLTSPGLALATVMKGLQDELAHLKMELAQYQSMYNKYDMSLGMRKRKAIKSKIENLLKAIDTKADQIYSLYDVLEGQKQSGQQLSEEDVEITLQSIGVDVDILKPKSAQGRDNHSESGDSDTDSELDLPWEGIEDTTGTGNMKERRQSWRL